ncbi:hypothetical protein [Legionella fallonii]|uniref:Uncharacterized protein n=1 Tax=Legionella fallonii LLAP-10 TaxID=1212491 RepID=A0A098GBB1_9GAMM|nr:hypothetical protein [Legionella fallonii]CEG58761.1 exported protein of unknown function [Legionella fallonii LLAP-10]
MLKNILLPISFSLATFIPHSSYSAPVFDDASLSSQCHVLAKHLGEIKESQKRASCSYKLYMSGIYVDNSGDKIIEKQYSNATECLNDAIEFLIFAQKFNCERLAEITEIKKELIQIKRQIRDK